MEGRSHHREEALAAGEYMMQLAEPRHPEFGTATTASHGPPPAGPPGSTAGTRDGRHRPHMVEKLMLPAPVLCGGQICKCGMSGRSRRAGIVGEAVGPHERRDEARRAQRPGLGRLHSGHAAGEQASSGRPSIPMRRAMRLGVRGVPASDGGAVALQPVLPLLATASTSDAGSTCTPI